LIDSDGQISGLDLLFGSSLLVRDYDGNPSAIPPTGALPIVIAQDFVTSGTGALKLEFDADAWNSTISFAPGISVTRGGTLALSFAPGVDIAAQSGRTIDLFDWTGVSPTGSFTVSSPYDWDLTKLYTTGEVTLLPTADFNGNSLVNSADLDTWATNFGLAAAADHNQGDANFDRAVDGLDFLAWQRQYSSGQTATASSALVPEPTTRALVPLGLLPLVGRRMRASGNGSFRRARLFAGALAALLTLAVFAPSVHADIFQWEYISPANPSLGKQPSATLAPDGTGANALPGTNLSNRNLTKAYLIGADLSAYPIYGGYEYPEIVGYVGANLTAANLSQADLSSANLLGANLMGANLTGAEVRHANFIRDAFGGGSGMTAAQLFSTASYQAHDLAPTRLKPDQCEPGGRRCAGGQSGLRHRPDALAALFHRQLSSARFIWNRIARRQFSKREPSGPECLRGELRRSFTCGFQFQSGKHRARPLRQRCLARSQFRAGSRSRRWFLRRQSHRRQPEAGQSRQRSFL
jgi:uncharacterized protein YjbI with pentapeptide repeats